MQKVNFTLRGIRAEEMRYALTNVRVSKDTRFDLKPAFSRQVRRTVGNAPNEHTHRGHRIYAAELDRRPQKGDGEQDDDEQRDEKALFRQRKAPPFERERAARKDEQKDERKNTDARPALFIAADPSAVPLPDRKKPF